MKKSIIIKFLVIQTIINLILSQSSDFGVYRCRNNSNLATSAFHQALQTALTSLPVATTLHGGFHHVTASTRVHALALCRGDIGIQDCQNCVNNSIPSLLRNCRNRTEAVVWYSNCIVRYSDREIVGILDSWISGELFNSARVSDEGEFSTALSSLMIRLLERAVEGDSVRKMAVGNVTYGVDSLIIYGMMQCTPDLAKNQCSECLYATITQIRTCCSGRVAARVFFPSCFFRYSNEHFYNESSVFLDPLPRNEFSSGKRSNIARTIYIVVPVMCFTLGLIGIGVWLFVVKKRKERLLKKESNGSSSLLDEHKQASTNDTVGMEIVTVESLQYDLKTIKAATNYFAPTNLVGKGGFGLVYKGALPNGQEVAVKRLSETSGQGVDEFVNEAILVAKLQHRNLVRLLGFCHEEKEKILIYEYVPNKSLDYFLFNSVKHGHLNWATRWKIIGGITRGMLYLHEDSRLRIIHRDLKASNILLDQDMNAKISDFGLARIFGVDQTLGNTNKIAGTLGYMSPEYAMHGRFSVKSDVFSFGVIILEIVSGRRNSSFYQQDDVEDLLLFAWKRWTSGSPLELLDPTLSESYSEKEVIRCIHLGLLCVQEDADARPSMASILNMLNNNSATIPEPKKPPYFLSKGLFMDKSGDVDKSIPVVSSEDDSFITKMSPR